VLDITQATDGSAVGAGLGTWFGYLDRQGNVSQRFKGGTYKGIAGGLCCVFPSADGFG
jgi:hypothetical protein